MKYQKLGSTELIGMDPKSGDVASKKTAGAFNASSLVQLTKPPRGRTAGSSGPAAAPKVPARARSGPTGVKSTPSATSNDDSVFVTPTSTPTTFINTPNEVPALPTVIPVIGSASALFTAAVKRHRVSSKTSRSVSSSHAPSPMGSPALSALASTSSFFIPALNSTLVTSSTSTHNKSAMTSRQASPLLRPIVISAPPSPSLLSKTQPLDMVELSDAAPKIRAKRVTKTTDKNNKEVEKTPTQSENNFLLSTKKPRSRALKVNSKDQTDASSTTLTLEESVADIASIIEPPKKKSRSGKTGTTSVGDSMGDDMPSTVTTSKTAKSSRAALKPAKTQATSSVPSALGDEKNAAITNEAVLRDPLTNISNTPKPRRSKKALHSATDSALEVITSTAPGDDITVASIASGTTPKSKLKTKASNKSRLSLPGESDVPVDTSLTSDSSLTSGVLLSNSASGTSDSQQKRPRGRPPKPKVASESSQRTREKELLQKRTDETVARRVAEQKRAQEDLFTIMSTDPDMFTSAGTISASSSFTGRNANTLSNSRSGGASFSSFSYSSDGIPQEASGDYGSMHEDGFFDDKKPQLRASCTIMDILLDNKTGLPTKAAVERQALAAATAERKRRRKERRVRNDMMRKRRARILEKLEVLKATIFEEPLNDSGDESTAADNDSENERNVEDIDESSVPTSPASAAALEEKLVKEYESLLTEVDTEEEEDFNASLSSTSLGARSFSSSSMVGGDDVRPGGEFGSDISAGSSMIFASDPFVSPNSSGSRGSSLPAGPQMHIVDGRMVLNEESLLVANADDDFSPREMVNEEYRHQDYRQFMGKRSAPTKWSPEEIRSLYRLLGQYGIDFQFISKFFPSKTRAQVKARYKKEEKERPRMIDLALRNKLNVDEEAFTEAVAKHREANPHEVIQMTGEMDGVGMSDVENDPEIVSEATANPNQEQSRDKTFTSTNDQEGDDMDDDLTRMAMGMYDDDNEEGYTELAQSMKKSSSQTPRDLTATVGATSTKRITKTEPSVTPKHISLMASSLKVSQQSQAPKIESSSGFSPVLKASEPAQPPTSLAPSKRGKRVVDKNTTIVAEAVGSNDKNSTSFSKQTSTRKSTSFQR